MTTIANKICIQQHIVLRNTHLFVRNWLRSHLYHIYCLMLDTCSPNIIHLFPTQLTFIIIAIFFLSKQFSAFIVYFCPSTTYICIYMHVIGNIQYLPLPVAFTFYSYILVWDLYCIFMNFYVVCGAYRDDMKSCGWPVGGAVMYIAPLCTIRGAYIIEFPHTNSS